MRNALISVITKKTLTLIMIFTIVFTFIPMIPFGNVMDEAQATVDPQVWIFGGKLAVSDSDYYKLCYGSVDYVPLPAHNGYVSSSEGYFSYTSLYYTTAGDLVIKGGKIVVSASNWGEYIDGFSFICENVRITNSDITIKTATMTKDEYRQVIKDFVSPSSVSKHNLSEYPEDIPLCGCMLDDVVIDNSTLKVEGLVVFESDVHISNHSLVEAGGGCFIFYMTYFSVLGMGSSVFIDNSTLTADSGMVFEHCELYATNSTLDIGTIKTADLEIDGKPFYKVVTTPGNNVITEVSVIDMASAINFTIDDKTIANFQPQPLTVQLTFSEAMLGVMNALAFVPKASEGTQPLYLPDPYVEAIDGTLHKSSEVNFYNESLHQKEVSQIQNDVKSWKVTVRTALAKKGIKLYTYLNGLDTEELYSYLDNGYTVKYDWYKAAGKNKKYKYVDSTDDNCFYDKDVKVGRTYFYKCKITIYDENGQIARTDIKDCKYGCRKFK